MSYTIREISEMLDLPASTIRYYDNQGLLPFVERTEGGYRRFSEDDLSLLRIIECLKQTGMPIKDIRQFTAWVRMGDDSLQQRCDMFHERRRAVQQQIGQLNEIMKVIDYKCWYYETALEAGTERVHDDKARDCLC